MKSKIEQKIEKAREATNEMFAALDELNESLSERICVIQLPKEGSPKITAAESSAILEKWVSIIRDKMEEQRKWMPKRGEYATTVGKRGEKLIVIFKEWKDSELFFHYAGITTRGDLKIGIPFGIIPSDIIRPATPAEIALLDSKLAEQGKRFDKEKLELVDIPKHKEPIIGEMAIFWDNDKCNAACKILDDDSGAFFIDNSETYWINAILFESPEQYKDFLKS